MQERRRSLIAIRSIQVPLILQSVLASFILINTVLIIAFLIGGALSGPIARLYLGMAVAAVEIICLVAVFMVARRQSSRIVGPFYRIEELAHRLKKGDLTARANIRTNDYFTEQVGALDDALRELHDRVHSLKEDVERARGEPGRDTEGIRNKLDWFRTGGKS